MKDNLVGRVVGYFVPHRLDPSQVDEGEPLDTERTVWARVERVLPGGASVMVRNIHDDRPIPPIPGGRQWRAGTQAVRIAALHTTMPESYAR